MPRDHMSGQKFTTVEVFFVSIFFLLNIKFVPVFVCQPRPRVLWRGWTTPEEGCVGPDPWSWSWESVRVSSWFLFVHSKHPLWIGSNNLIMLSKTDYCHELNPILYSNQQITAVILHRINRFEFLLLIVTSDVLFDVFLP